MNTDYIYTFYEETLKYNWDMSPVDRSLNLDRVNQYLNQIYEPVDRDFIRDLLNKTLYINFDNFKNALFHSFNQFQEKIGTEGFYILTEIDFKKFGSENWLVALLWPYLRQMNVKGFMNQCTLKKLGPDTYNIVFIDDAIYSGGKVLNIMDVFIEGLAKELSIKVKQLKDHGYHFNYHIIIPFVSTYGVRENISYEMNKFYSDINYIIHYVYEVKPLYEEIDIGKYYGSGLESDYDDSDVSGIWTFDDLNNLLIYFDHKIADPHSTYPHIYKEGYIPRNPMYPDGEKFGPLVKNLPSRYKIKELEQLYMSLSEIKSKHKYYFYGVAIKIFMIDLNEMPIEELTNEEVAKINKKIGSLDQYKYWLSLSNAEKLEIIKDVIKSCE